MLGGSAMGLTTTAAASTCARTPGRRHSSRSSALANFGHVSRPDRLFADHRSLLPSRLKSPGHMVAYNEASRTTRTAGVELVWADSAPSPIPAAVHVTRKNQY